MLKYLGDEPEAVVCCVRVPQFLPHSAASINRSNQLWLIRDVLPRYGVGMMYGADGSGKTFLALDMCLSLATGKPWFGHQSRVKGRILYMVGEGKIEDRIDAWIYSHDADVIDINRRFFYANGSPDLSEAEGRIAMEKAIDSVQDVSLIVFDTLTAVSPGGEECSKEGIGKVMSFFRDLANKRQCMVLITHHCGKQAINGPRGWSGIRAGCDCVIEITKRDLEGCEEEQPKVWTVLKMREGKNGTQGTFVLGYQEIGRGPEFDDFLTEDESAFSRIVKDIS